jgi:trehalose synthase
VAGELLTHVPIALLPPARFKEILDPEQSAELDRTIELAQKAFAGRVIWNVNSTARGGGVAEMLQSLIAYTRGAGVDARWVVIGGDEPFFKVTKRIHNMLHGSEGDGLGLGPDDEATYREISAANARELVRLVRPHDLVLLHDPQTAGLVAPLREMGAKVVWRCHVGVDLANDTARAAWSFLLPHVHDADAFVFSRDAFVWDDLDRARAVIIPPSIDAFSPKNQELSQSAVAAILHAAGLQDGGSRQGLPGFVREDGTPGRVDRRAELHGGASLDPTQPVLVQISRWDRLKDHAGVLEAFRDDVAPHGAGHLVLAGPAAAAVSDDPEGLEVLAEIIELREACPPDVRRRVHVASLPMDDAQENAAIVNALQRRADVVAQKSLAEGFGLTVAEAMWKGRPVVASNLGGIRDQVIDGETGVLVESQDLAGFAEAVRRLLDDPERAGRLGVAAREHVRGSFLGPRHLTQYVELFVELLSGAAGRAEEAARA